MAEDGDADRALTDRVLELFVYAPIGLLVYVRETTPSFVRLFVTRGRTEVEQRRQTLVDQIRTAPEPPPPESPRPAPDVPAPPQFRKLVSDGVAFVRARAGDVLAPGPAGPASSSPAPPSRPAPTEAARDPGVGAGERLAIPDYDDLGAAQVLDRLDGLPAGDLEAIREYERGHRGRHTVLGKIDQLLAPSS